MEEEKICEAENCGGVNPTLQMAAGHQTGGTIIYFCNNRCKKRYWGGIKSGRSGTGKDKN